jgi:hypothetical protein
MSFEKIDLGEKTQSSSSKKQSKMQIFEKGSMLAQKYNGESLSTSYSICKGRNSLKFRCLNEHTFFIAAETLETMTVAFTDDVNDEWCYKCRKFYDCCSEVAATVGLVVVDGLYQTKIKLQCEKKKHEMKISYTKKLQTLSCADCRREEREEQKE